MPARASAPIAIAPGLINTPLIYKQISGQYKTVEEMVAARDALVPLGKMGTAHDVANAAVFLLRTRRSHYRRVPAGRRRADLLDHGAVTRRRPAGFGRSELKA